VKLRLYFDEDSTSHALIQALQARGVDVISPLDTGMRGRSDEEHLEFAAAEGRAVYTYNIADFNRLHASWLRAGRGHAGLILAQQQQYSVGEQLRRLLKLVATRTAEEMADRAEFLSAWA
jgi:hypothetical protein